MGQDQKEKNRLYMRKYLCKKREDPEWHERYKEKHREYYSNNREARIAASKEHKRKEREDPERLVVLRAREAKRARERREDPEYRSREREIQQKSRRKRFAENPELRERHCEQSKQRQAKHTQWLSDIKATQGCKTCSEQDPRVLDFHHRDPSEKEFTIGSRRSKSKEVLLKEIAKCDVLCANCHRKLTHG